MRAQVSEVVILTQLARKLNLMFRLLGPPAFWAFSPAESPILLRREIPMAWGTTTDSLRVEIRYLKKIK